MFLSVSLVWNYLLVDLQLLKNKDWKNIAKKQLNDVFIMTDANDPFLKRMADLYCDDAVGGVLDPSSVSVEDNNNKYYNETKQVEEEIPYSNDDNDDNNDNNNTCDTELD